MFEFQVNGERDTELIIPFLLRRKSDGVHWNRLEYCSLGNFVPFNGFLQCMAYKTDGRI